MGKPALLILPGWGGSRALWVHQTTYLEAILQTNVIAVFDKQNVQEMAEEVLQQAPQKFHLAGHSLGGWVAQEIAIKEPGRLLSLSLISTWTGAKTLQLQEVYSNMLKQIDGREHLALLHELRPSLVHPSRSHDGSLMEQIRLSQVQTPPNGLKINFWHKLTVHQPMIDST